MTEEEVREAQRLAGQQYMADTPSDMRSKAAYAAKVASAGPGWIARNVPTAAVLTTGAYAAGLFEEEDIPKLGDPRREAYDKWRSMEDKNSAETIALFREWNGPAHVTRSDYERRTGGPSRKPDWWFLPESFAATEVAHGGEIVGRGTGTSDSIPARLSDGEFVMTADAVRNAGGGDRNLGAARMYDMMRRFEGGTA
jgi:hypothetical protein